MSKRNPLPTRLIIWFVQNQELSLTLTEIARLFSVNRRNAGATLRYSVRNGWFERVMRDDTMVYVAGPRLRDEL